MLVRSFVLTALFALTAGAAIAADAAPAGVTQPQPLPSSVTATGRDYPESFADLADKLLPSVVNISTTQILNKDGEDQAFPDMPTFPPGSPFEDFFKDFFERHRGGPGAPGIAPRRATSLGSGFIIDPAGLVVTNNHVIDSADEITVVLHDNTELKAELVGRDTKTDLALLRVKPTKPLTAVIWGDSDKMRVGDWVLAIGNPFGLGGTVTQGIVSARARDINAGPYDDFIQTDASINRGNSGGPMFNLQGQVIGVNTAIFSPTGGSVGIGFAIPVNLAKNVISQLKDSGKITRGWIGVRIQQVTDDIAKSLGLPKAGGALVSSVTEKSPAADAGIKSGDVITTFAGREVGEMRRLPRMVAETNVGTKAPLGVWRDGKAITLNIKVGELPVDQTEEKAEAAPAEKQAPTKSEAIPDLGIKVADLTPALRQRFELDDKAKGVLVIDVDPNSDAAEKGLQPGDLIQEAGQDAVKSAADLGKVAASAKKSSKPLLLLVERNGDARFVAIGFKAAKAAE